MAEQVGRDLWLLKIVHLLMDLSQSIFLQVSVGHLTSILIIKIDDKYFSDLSGTKLKSPKEIAIAI